MRLPRVQFTVRRLMMTIAILAILFGGIAHAVKVRGLQKFFQQGGQAIELGAYFFPRLTWTAGVAFIAAIIAAFSDTRFWRSRSAWAFFPFIIPIIILAYGVVFVYDKSSPSNAQQRLMEINVLFLMHLPILIILLVFLRSNWIAVLGLSIVATWFSIGSSIISTMSITNTWL